MRRKTRRLLLRLVVVSVLVFVSICAFLIYKERETLSRLGNPGQNAEATQVYSRWLDLAPQTGGSRERVLGWLAALNYRPVTGTPSQAGDYSANDAELIVFSRPFRYPDKDYPAQLLRVEFRRDRLSALEALSGHAALVGWRLEPKVLAEWNTQTKTSRRQVRVADLPPYVPRAVLAIEDKRFFQHGALDWLGIGRAFWVDVRHGGLRQGASTISQQLARSIFLNVERTWRRKALEAALAVYLEVRYSKPQLLEMYLNQVYWGQEGSESLLGVESASEAFFGKPARVLTISESAVLAGMLQSPNRYSPRSAPEIARERRDLVLGLMQTQNIITDSQYAAALTERVRTAPAKKSDESAYFLAALRDQLAERYSLPLLLSQGWRIFTTLDPLLQHDAMSALKPSAGQAALVAIDPASGAIRAWVGGTNYQTNPFDHASAARRQPGSAFKPFVALAALESRKATTATLLDDKPLSLQGVSGVWSPRNYDRKYRGQVSVWDAVVYSLNVPIVRLAMLTGVPSLIDAARRAGIESPLRDDLSLALGTSEVSLLELTGAYATLANHGDRCPPYNLESIVGGEGNILESHQALPQKALAPEPVFLVTQMLEGVLDTGTGKAARTMGLIAPAAGKTGTSENFQDAWFLGYTTNLAAGVWVGYDKPKSLGRSAAGIALPIWTAFMKRAVVLDPPQNFEEPPGLIWKTIDTDSGLLARSGCPHRRKAAFLAGTEPTQDCPLHAGGLTGFFQRWRSKT
jgi:penicillin-binding protein 1B